MALLLELPELLQRMNISPASLTETQTATYLMWLTGLDKAFKSYCKWNLTLVEGDVQYYSGTGNNELQLRTPYVVNNSTLAVRVDPTGYFGQSSSPFASSTAWTKGTDYALRLEGDRGKSGCLIKLPGNSAWWWPSDGIYFRGPGGLSFQRWPVWPVGFGNVKVTCDYGFAAGSVPEDLRLAMAGGVAIVRNFVQKGMVVTSETLGDYNWSGQLLELADFASVRSYLSFYRDVQI